MVLLVGAIFVATGWGVTAPRSLDEVRISSIIPDPERGRMVFYAGGCASCHSAPDASGEEKLHLGGGRAFATEFGTFYAPNISPHMEAGIGGWSTLEIANAVIKGTSPGGQHYYPAFPYTSYAQATLEDAVSLGAFLRTLPAVSSQNKPHDVSFPFNIRRSLGGWKLLFARRGWVVDGNLTEQQMRGRYLVEGLGHCGECHTDRNALGGTRLDAWLAGAPNPNGKGRIPDITASGLKWTEGDIAEYLKSGFTPDFDTAGGEMADVVENTSKLTDADREAIAAYLKIVPGSK
ncbi:cytochrome c [Aliiroseovarius sp. KMU-50]|uniref:Cytochrome c n=1 Tax=Aliiroseovarius salicola TaxID=3009082 RepID=A0ABT4VZF1_9RHOB|nr:cytochrome c [Aliiroseovarius sp. KMU-50]MDA5093115.1 cytochrome c [Aliiroseovarius sp. KMU-50]